MSQRAAEAVCSLDTNKASDSLTLSLSFTLELSPVKVIPVLGAFKPNFTAFKHLKFISILF